MFMKTSTKINNYFTSVVTQKIQNIENNTNDLIVGKMKNETWNLSLKSFERLTSKMYTS